MATPAVAQRNDRQAACRQRRGLARRSRRPREAWMPRPSGLDLHHMRAARASLMDGWRRSGRTAWISGATTTTGGPLDNRDRACFISPAERVGGMSRSPSASCAFGAPADRGGPRRGRSSVVGSLRDGSRSGWRPASTSLRTAQLSRAARAAGRGKVDLVCGKCRRSRQLQGQQGSKRNLGVERSFAAATRSRMPQRGERVASDLARDLGAHHVS